MIGQVVCGKYKVLRPLDQGGMSKIYVARQLDQNREVVVKILQEQHRAQPKTLEHFRREIYIMGHFQHPNAVAYYDSSLNEAPGPILVMEYVRGIDLFTLLQREGKLAPDRVGRLLAQLCEVLEAAHDQGIVHRDIKPGNVMVLNASTPQETIKLMDFGLAKMSSQLYISPEELVDFSIPAASGTPEYIPPEQVLGTEMDGRGDLYSVGVILFELLTGRRPFQQTNIDDLLLAHAHDEPPSFAEVGATDIPAAIEEVVQSCLAKHADQRPRSATELAQRYEKALGRRITVARRTSPELVRPTTTSKRPSGTVPALRSPSTPAPRSSGGGVRHSVEASMPEAMAIVKLRGFIYDLGGEVIESVPGMIKVRVPERQAQPQKSSLFGWSRGSSDRTAAPTASELELHMERRDPAQPNKLTITLVMRPGRGLVTTEWHKRCKKMGMELQAYLMGR